MEGDDGEKGGMAPDLIEVITMSNDMFTMSGRVLLGFLNSKALVSTYVFHSSQLETVFSQFQSISSRS
jgi:hypothetical protein